MAGIDDIVLIAGKGHETYQEIKGVRYPMDDRLIANEALSSQANDGEVA
jgi:UDP-N-acetylmuramoyl-L-alanyl-D-glutamate--2,6-diaminopimelate ligase